MKTILLALAALLASPAHAERVQTCNGAKFSVPDGWQAPCSATWSFSASCTGEDLWNKWKVDGQSKTDEPYIRPWADTPIVVIGYEVMKLQAKGQATWRDRFRDLFWNALNDRLSWFMIGSGMNSQPDAMLWLGPGETRARLMWPAGIGNIWPSKAKARKSQFEDILDLHGHCYGGGPITVYMTLYYIPQR